MCQDRIAFPYKLAFAARLVKYSPARSHHASRQNTLATQSFLQSVTFRYTDWCSQCVRRVRECDLAERMQVWQPELKALAHGLVRESDPILQRMGQLAQQIVENSAFARGRNCTWYGRFGDRSRTADRCTIIHNESASLAPILTILGKKLYRSDSLPSSQRTPER